jgi:hypothetical protein
LQPMGGWPHCFWVSKAPMVGAHGKESWSPHGSQEAKDREGKKQLGSQHLFQWHTSNGLISSTRPHLIKVPLRPKSTTGWRPNFQHMGLWRTFQIQTTVQLLYKPRTLYVVWATQRAFHRCSSKARILVQYTYLSSVPREAQPAENPLSSHLDA